jgi:coproporphyrinogen III oxidase-like Fe-S oxidoreductase
MAKDPELLDLLAKAHLTRVLIGIESLNQAALDDINKGQSIADIERAGIACRDHGIRVIASVVLGIDEDSPEDIKRSVDFAKSIDAYQIQPAVLTPFPGTPVYDEFVKEGRMITKDWGLFDMTNVTFQPRRMSPWTLQECFFDACDNFYDLPSAFRIWNLFGPEYGLRRIWLAFGTSAGVPIARFAADHFPNTPYYKLKRIPWKYAKDEIAPIPTPEPQPEAAALPFEAIEKSRDLDEESRRRIAVAVAGVGAVALAVARRPAVRASLRRHSVMAALV